MPLALDGASAAKQYRSISAKKPLVQCITNFVSMDIMANVLNAIGASPAMVHSVNEVEEFLTVADALVVNVGTLSGEWVESMKLASTVAAKLNKPWVLDPVGAGATKFRTQAILELLSKKPAILKGNASEILALAGATGVSKGVDSTADTWDALEAGKELAKRYGNVVAISGKEDLVTDGERVIGIDNGVAMISKITATGCSLTAVMAAFLAVAPDSSPDSTMLAAAYAFTVFGICAENVEYEGPGSLRVQMIDKLYNMVEDSIDIEERSFISLLDKDHQQRASS